MCDNEQRLSGPKLLKKKKIFSFKNIRFKFVSVFVDVVIIGHTYHQERNT